MPCVIFHGDERAVLVSKGGNVLQASQENMIPHYAECGGRGKCTTCRVKVFSGIENLMARNDLEMKQAQSRNWDSHIRLACQSRVMGDVVVERLVRNEFQVQEAYLEPYYHSEPVERELVVLGIQILGFEKEWKEQTGKAAVVYDQILSLMQELILVTGGTPETARGNIVLGYYGFISEENLLEKALRACILIQTIFQKKVLEWKEDLKSDLTVTIGLDMDHCLVGSFGSHGKKEIKILGKALSRVWKLIELCPKIDVFSLVSEEIYNKSLNYTKYGKKLRVRSRKDGTEVLSFEPKGFTEDDEFLSVYESYFLIKDKMSEFTKSFYVNFFQMNPHFIQLFRGDMSRQYKMLRASLKTLVYGISRWEEISPMIRELGRRHKYYGTETKDFVAFRDCLLVTLEGMLGRDWDEKKNQSWKKIIDKMSQKMIEGYTEDLKG